MKGIVFNLLEQCVSTAHGEDMWDDILAAAGLDGAYTSLGNYDDQHAFALIAAGAKLLQISPEELERWFGRASIGPLAKLYPEFFEPHSSTRSFLLTLNDIIHPEVRKLYPGADVPDFEFEDPGENRLAMRYYSKRKMCAFAEGLIEGAADHFGERVHIEQTTCMKHGAETCTLVSSFNPLRTDG